MSLKTVFENAMDFFGKTPQTPERTVEEIRKECSQRLQQRREKEAPMREAELDSFYEFISATDNNDGTYHVKYRVALPFIGWVESEDFHARKNGDRYTIITQTHDLKVS